MLSRRNLIRRAAGTAAGAGLLLSAGLGLPVRGDDEGEGEHNKCKALPRPIPHISRPPGSHIFFPGPPDGSAPPTFIGIHDTANQFSGDSFQIGNVTIAVTAVTPKSTGHGFRFVSDPATTIVNYAQIGRERNVVFSS